MCLAIPAKIMSIDNPSDLLILAQADFGGIQKTISLSLTPEAKVNDYVIVHAGFAISILDQEKAKALLHELSISF